MSNSAQIPTYIFKVPVAGDGAVGKTSLIVRYTQGTFSDTYKMTIGTSFAVRTVDFGNVVVKLQIWDLAGQPHFSGVRPLFYQGATGVVYVFSVTDRASFDHLPGWVEETTKNAGNINGILLGNKADLVDQRVVSREEAESYAQQLGLTYLETSAKMDLNVGDAFRLIGSTIIKGKWPSWEPALPILTQSTETPPATTIPQPETIPSPPSPSPTPEPPTSPTPAEPFIPPTPEPPVVPESESLQPATSEPEPSPPEYTEPAETPDTAPTEEEFVPEALTPTLPGEVSTPEPEPIAPSTPETPLAKDNSTIAHTIEEDITVTYREESSLIEFAGIDPHEISTEDFEQRVVNAMQRLGVSDVGVLGTFLRSLTRQGQRDVVLESLESLQEEEH